LLRLEARKAAYTQKTLELLADVYGCARLGSAASGKIGRASGGERGEITVCLEFRRVLFRSVFCDWKRGRQPIRRRRLNCSPMSTDVLDWALQLQERSEERLVGKEGRSLCAWSSDVCSSDLSSAIGSEEGSLYAEDA